MNNRIIAFLLMLGAFILSANAFGTIKGKDMSNVAPEPFVKCEINAPTRASQSPVTVPSGDRHVFESSCWFENNYSGGSQFDYGRTHYVYTTDDEVYFDNMWIRGTYVRAEYVDDSHSMLEFCSGQPVGEVMGENGEIPVFFGCAVMNENGSLGLMDRIFADVDASGRITISDHPYFGIQYFIIYDESGNVYSLEYRHSFWEIDPTTISVPQDLAKESYLYNYTQQGYENTHKQRILTIYRDGEEVYLDGMVPYLDSEVGAGVVKGVMKNGNIVIPVPQLIMINGSYTERLFAYKDGKPLSNLILYYDQSRNSYSPGNGVVVYGGSGLYAGYCYGFTNISISRFATGNVSPKEPFDIERSDAINNYFSFKFSTDATTGEQLYKGWIGVEVFVDGELFTFNPSDYKGNLLKSITRIPLRTQLLEEIDANNYIYWGNIEADAANTFAILLPSTIQAEEIGVRLVYAVDGHDNYSEVITVPTVSDPPTDPDDKRIVVLEEFSTEKCVNCPAAVEKLHQTLENMTEEERKHLVIVTHHAGFYTDFLTQPCDEELTWFYGGEYTYAPAFMVDRTAAGDDNTPVFQCPTSWQLLKSKIEKAMKRPAGTSITLEGEADEDMVYISATGIFADEVETDNVRVTVYLLEDNVESQKQAGADASFVHNHVIRAYNSDAFGKAPSISGKDWHYDTALKIPAGNTENIEVAVFMAHYNPNDRTDCKILNANKIPLSQLLGRSGVDMDSDSIVEEKWYDLTGSEVEYPGHGVFVRVQIFDNGHRQTSKIIR